MPDSFRGQIALITGASSGIGLELARCFAADGWNIVLIARSEVNLRSIAKELKQEYSVAVTSIPADLSQADAPQKIFITLHNQNLEISALVNNAGFGDYGFFHESDWEKQEQMLAVNIRALTQLTLSLLPAMMERKDGKILNVASTAGFFPGPLMAVYYATKAYVISFSHALSNELEGSGVICTCLCPGPTETGFQGRAQMQKSRLMHSTMMDAKTVAQLGYKGLIKGQTLVVPGSWNKLVVWAPRVFSLKHCAAIVRKSQAQSRS